MAKEEKKIIVGLDIGTSKIVAIIAEVQPDGQHQIIGIGQSESKGLKKGVVVNLDQTVNSIEAALSEAETMAGVKAEVVCVGIAGGHIRSFNSPGMVTLKNKEITQWDLDRVLEMAKSINLPEGQQFIHAVTQEYVVDGQEGVHEPVGMSGMRLEVRAHIVTGAVSAVDNIVKCIRRCHLDVADLMLQPIASAEAVLSQDEKNMGAVVIDIGGGTTDIAIFTDGVVRHTEVIPIAGDQVTNDIAMIFRTPVADAEEIKMRYGVALQSLVSPEEQVEAPGIGDRPPSRYSRQMLAAIIEARMEELFGQAKKAVEDSGYSRQIASGIVLTGGTMLLPGMLQLAEKVFDRPVRLGLPQYTGHLAEVVKSPRYSTVHGLLIEAKRQHEKGLVPVTQQTTTNAFIGKVKSWFWGNI
ncbi:MAG: cell division protein FtsA [Oxalobacter sp.]|nr:cell division protein FtsA [Oxalobacter sp.]